MKKLLLIASVCLMGLSLYAENDKPLVIIHKSNGGYWAWLNLYNDILYTPALDEETPATLDCTGAGWSACRVPRQNTYTMNSLNRVPNGLDISPLVNDAINEIIEISEDHTRGTQRGSISKKIAVQDNTRGGGMVTYIVQGVWSYNAYGEGTLKIYLHNSDILNHRI